MKPSNEDFEQQNKAVIDQASKALDHSVDSLSEHTQAALSQARHRALSQAKTMAHDLNNETRRERSWNRKLVAMAASVFVIVTTYWVTNPAVNHTENTDLAEQSQDQIPSLVWFATETADLTEDEWETLDSFEFVIWLSEIEDEALDQSS